MSFTAAPRPVGVGRLWLDSLTGCWYPDVEGMAVGTYTTLDGQALFMPVGLSVPATLVALAVYTGTTGVGNYDVGLYTPDGTRLRSTGATAHPAATGWQKTTVTGLALLPGLYYLAMVRDTATDQYARTVPSAPFGAGVGQLSATFAYPLPSSVTLSRDVSLAAWPAVAAILEGVR